MNVVNLWVEREKRRRDAEDGERIVLCCKCGCSHFRYYQEEGLVCAECDKIVNIPKG